MNNKISQLRKFFTTECKKINDKTIKRNRKLTFQHIFYFLTHIVTNNSSYSLTNSELKIKDIVDVSKQAISKKRNMIDCNLIDSLRRKLLKHINETKIMPKSNLYAVDGSGASFDKELTEEDYKLTKNETYCRAYMGCLYDCINKCPVKNYIDNYLDERKSFFDNLLNEVPRNSIVMFDRGYYSSELLKYISKKNLFLIVRMKSNSLIVQHMIDKNIDEYFYLNKFKLLKVIKYSINNEDYYLCTNLIDKSINYLKDMYHKRWSVEEYFKTIKCNMKANNFNCKNVNKNKQDLYVQTILTILARYLEALSLYYHQKITNKLYSINHKNTLNILGNNIIYLILFKKSNKKIINFIIIINKERTYGKPDRHFKRIRIKPTSKWYYVGIAIKNLLLDD